jgi:hypothetical protein
MSIETLGTVLIVVGVIVGIVLIIRIAAALSDEGIDNGAGKSPPRNV